MAAHAPPQEVKSSVAGNAPDQEPSNVEEALAMSLARFEDDDGGNADDQTEGGDAGEQGDREAGGGQGDDATTTGDDSSDADKGSEATDPPAEPAAVGDLDFIPEEHRDTAANLSPEFLKWVEEGTLMRGRFTQLTQENADKVRFYDELTGDQEAMDALMAFARERRQGGNGSATPGEPAATDDQFDYDALFEDVDFEQATNAEIRAALTGALRQVHTDARKQAVRVLDEQIRQPAQTQNEGVQALKAYQDQHDIADEDFTRAVTEAVEHYAALEQYSPSIWVEKDIGTLLKPFLKGAQPKSGQRNKDPGTTAPKGAKPRPTSIRGGGGKVSPAPVPKHTREGRAPESRDEMVDELLERLSARRGTRVTREDLEAAAKRGK